MEFFFPTDDLESNPRAKPEETRITAVSAKSYPEGRRARVRMEMTPFQKRPHIEVVIVDAEGTECASANFVEPMTFRLEFTMHVRGAPKNPYMLHARLYYPEGPAAEPVSCSFEMLPPGKEIADEMALPSDSE